jgi:hypothetical protein
VDAESPIRSHYLKNALRIFSMTFGKGRSGPFQASAKVYSTCPSATLKTLRDGHRVRVESQHVITLQLFSLPRTVRRRLPTHGPMQDGSNFSSPFTKLVVEQMDLVGDAASV